jgi:hypothetical protein
VTEIKDKHIILSEIAGKNNFKCLSKNDVLTCSTLVFKKDN